MVHELPMYRITVELLNPDRINYDRPRAKIRTWPSATIPVDAGMSSDFRRFSVDVQGGDVWLRLQIPGYDGSL